LNYYRRFPGDYARDTQHLDTEEHRLYTLLLDVLYATEKCLPLDQNRLFEICKVKGPISCEKVLAIVEQFFFRRKNGYSNRRFEKELKLTKSRIKAAKENGKSGGRPHKPRGNPVGSRNITQGKAPQPHIANDQISEPDRFSSSPTLMQKLGISLSLWADFKNMREEIKLPLVSGGENYILTELLDFQARGENPVAVLSQAIRTSSYVLYPVKKEKENGKLDPKKRTERNIRNAGLPN